MNDNENNSLNEGFNIDTSISDDFSEDELPPEDKGFAKEVLEWLDVMCIAIVAVVVVFSFIFRVATIDGNSMLNTLHHGDKIVITNLNYEPKYGDIVVISRNAENSVEGQLTSEEPIIKRVIAVGGQTVNIDFETRTVYVDGVALKEDYIGSPTIDIGDVKFPVYVPKGHIFVLGDNRSDSMDSRFSNIGDGGIIDNRYILGHAVFRFFPFNQIGALD